MSQRRDTRRGKQCRNGVIHDEGSRAPPPGPCAPSRSEIDAEPESVRAQIVGRSKRSLHPSLQGSGRSPKPGGRGWLRPAECERRGGVRRGLGAVGSVAEGRVFGRVDRLAMDKLLGRGRL